MQTVDRERLIAFSDGILLSRTVDGIVTIGDDPNCYAAEAAMDKGETVALLVDGNIVSYCRLVDGAYVEIKDISFGGEKPKED